MNMKKSKKLLSIILTLGIVLSLLPTTALPLTVTPVSGEGWSLDSSGVLTISSDTGMSDWLTNDSGITANHIYVSSIVIEDAVTSIPDSGFSDCYNAHVVTIGNGVTTIGSYAFKSDDITSLTFGSKVQSIGDYAFEYTAITSLSLPNSLTEIGKYAFYDCEAITSALSIPNSVTTIGEHAFDYCISIPSVTLPDNNTSIGTYAFYYCKGITSVTITNVATSIGEKAFCQCNGITSLSFPDGITTIDAYAFYGIGNNLDLTIPDTVTEIGEGAFSYCSLASVNIPNSVKIIGDSAFSSTGPSTVSIPASVITIGASAFDSCSNVYFEGATPPTKVGANVFATSSILQQIYVPAGSGASYKSVLSDYAGKIVELSASITKDGATTYYTTLEDALVAAENGDTVNLLGSTTEYITYTVTSDKTITIDGHGNTLTGGEVYDGHTITTALTLNGEGTIILKNITLAAGTADKVYGFVVGKSSETANVLNVLNLGNVNVYAGVTTGKGYDCYGLVNYSAGTVNVTSVTADCTNGTNEFVYSVDNEGSGTVNVTSATAYGTNQQTYAAYNYASGTINVNTATANGGGSEVYGVYNYGSGTINAIAATGDESNYSSMGACNRDTGTINVNTASGGYCGASDYSGSGTINVATATGGSVGVQNDTSGVVNVITATGTNADGTGVYNTEDGTINVNSASGYYGVDNYGSGTVNVVTATGTESDVYYEPTGGVVNVVAATAEFVAQLTLNAGSGAICALDSITVAASDSTTIGTLPGVYRNGAYSSDWYTVSASLFSGTTVTGATTLYSSLYTPDPAIDIAAISGVTAPVNGGVPTSTIADTTEYTATITWSPTASTFAASTAYTATITIVPKTGYTLTGVAENFFTVAGAVATNAADSGVVTAVFPATAADTIINTPAIAGVTAPVKGAAPTSSIADTTEYTATITWSPTASTFAASTVYTATITITPKTGYTLTGITENFFTVAGAAATNAADSGVVTAVFPATAASGGGGSAVSDPTATVSGSTATVTVTGTTSGGRQTISVAGGTMTSLTQAAQTAEATGNAVAEINTGSNSGLTNIGVTIPGRQFDIFASGTDAVLRLTTCLGTVTFSSDAVDAIDAAGSGDVVFTMGTVDASTLTTEQQAAVGNRPVYSFSVTVGGKTVSEFGSTVTASIPYTLGANEDPNAIVVYYVDASGTLKLMQGKYDTATGNVIFETTHFSDYVIGYKKVNFSDVADTAWCADAVTFLSARGITTGTTATTFSPDAALTRGQFITLLLKTYGVAAVTNAADNFSDAGDMYYTGYLAAAKQLDITSGVGDNKFAPDKAITRQQMFTLLYNALKALDKLPEGSAGKTLSDFKDSSSVASYAQEAMSYLVQIGVVSGNNGSLLPQDTTTRAQMAQVLYNLMGK